MVGAHAAEDVVECGDCVVDVGAFVEHDAFSPFPGLTVRRGQTTGVESFVTSVTVIAANPVFWDRPGVSGGPGRRDDESSGAC